jgi:Apoptosis regulator proteins, Bcl-2 family
MDKVKDTSRLLADDIVRYVTVSPTPPVTNPHSATLRRIVDMVSSRHHAVFESIISKVGVRAENQQTDVVMCQTTFDKVAHELFADSHYNWGRIVMLYAFAAWLAKHPSGKPEKDGNDEVAKLISSATGDFVSGELSTWIVHQGGWVCVWSVHFSVKLCLPSKPSYG